MTLHEALKLEAEKLKIRYAKALDQLVDVLHAATEEPLTTDLPIVIARRLAEIAQITGEATAIDKALRFTEHN